MDKTISNHTLMATYKQQSIDQTVESPLNTAQPIAPASPEPSIGTNLTYRAISQTGNAQQQIAGQQIPKPSPQTEPGIFPPDKIEPLSSASRNKTQLGNQYTCLWQEMIKTGVHKNAIAGRFFANKMKTLLIQFNQLPLCCNEQLEILTNYYIKSAKQLNTAIQEYRNDKKTIKYHIHRLEHSTQRISSLSFILDQVETGIKDCFDIRRHLTNLSQSHYSLSSNDCEHKEFDECNTTLQKEYQKELKVSSNMEINSCFSNDLFREMNVSIYSPSGHLLVGINVDAKTCLYEEREESGVILDQMTFNKTNPVNFETLKKKFQSQVATKLNKTLHSTELTHMITFLCSQRPVNILHNLLNQYFIGLNLAFSLSERETRTEIQIHQSGDISVETELSIQKHILFDNRPGKTSKFNIDQAIDVQARFLISFNNQKPPHFHKIEIQMHEPVAIQFNC